MCPEILSYHRLVAWNGITKFSPNNLILHNTKTIYQYLNIRKTRSFNTHSLFTKAQTCPVQSCTSVVQRSNFGQMSFLTPPLTVRMLGYISVHCCSGLSLLCPRPHRVEALSNDARLTCLTSVCRIHRA